MEEASAECQVINSLQPENIFLFCNLQNIFLKLFKKIKTLFLSLYKLVMVTVVHFDHIYRIELLIRATHSYKLFSIYLVRSQLHIL